VADVRVTRAQHGTRLSAVQVGDVIEIRLSENPTTGYRWQFTASANLALDTDAFRPVNDGAIGTGGERVLRYRALEPGKASITAVYCRSWEAATPQDRFAVEADIV
jgi:inhibitor of cysteine peptidase